MENIIEFKNSDQHEGCTRAYVRNSKAYYAASLTNENIKVMVGMYDLEGGGTSGEFSFQWVNLGDKLLPQLKVFDDAWSALWQFKDLLEIMAHIDSSNITEIELCAILDSLEIKDITKYKQT